MSVNENQKLVNKCMKKIWSRSKYSWTIRVPFVHKYTGFIPAQKYFVNMRWTGYWQISPGDDLCKRKKDPRYINHPTDLFSPPILVLKWVYESPQPSHCISVPNYLPFFYSISNQIHTCGLQYETLSAHSQPTDKPHTHDMLLTKLPLLSLF